jgi:hypothetical protein
MIRRVLLAGAAVAVLMGVVVVRAQEPASPARSQDKAAKLKEDLELQQQNLARRFGEFQQQLLRLQQRLEKSPRKEDQDKAVVLKKALERAQENLISTQFESLVDYLKSQKFTKVGDIKAAHERTLKLADDLREVLALLNENSRALQLREQRLRLEEILKRLERVIHDQKVARTINEINKDAKTAKNAQVQVTQATQKLDRDITGKNAKSGDPRKGEGKKGEGKDGAKSGEGKKGEPKERDDKKAGDAQGPKVRSKKEEDKKAGDAKKGDNKEGAKSNKDGDSKSGDSKSGDSKQGQAKDGSKNSSPSKSKGDSNPQDPNSPADKKGDNNAKEAPPKDGPPPDETAQVQKRIREANYDQHRAEDKIDRGDKPGSKKDQDEAVRKLEEAKKKLEDLLRQLREEELERLLASLQARCEKMLAMQINVQEGTIRVAREIDRSPDKTATRDQQQDSLRLSDKEKDIVTEATKAIEMLEAEGSAVAFPEVFQQVREDMKNVQGRLSVVDVGKVTQGTEQDIIDTLKEMIEALKKARQDLDNKKSPPSGQPPPNVDQKLLDQIAELKMIRSMQIRVNNRTQLYGREYEGEQAMAPRIRQELHQLSDRQERIFEVTNRIAKGDNR